MRLIINNMATFSASPKYFNKLFYEELSTFVTTFGKPTVVKENYGGLSKLRVRTNFQRFGLEV